MNINRELDQIVERMKTRRIELGLSYQDLADATGLSKSTLQRYETGFIQNLPLSKVSGIAKALHVSEAYLMCWTDDPSFYPSDNDTLPSDEQQLLDSYRMLNDKGQEKLIEYADDLVSSGRYEKNSEDRVGESA